MTIESYKRSFSYEEKIKRGVLESVVKGIAWYLFMVKKEAQG